jgi:hypothetical protein
MVSQTQREQARRTAIGFFETVKIGLVQRNPCVWQVVKSPKQARQLRRQPVCDGTSFGALKQRLLTQLVSEADRQRPNIAKTMREHAWEVASVCPELIEVPDSAATEPWLDEVEADARGLFLSLCFPGASESKALFDLIRAGYEAGGFPCGLPSWPATRIAIFSVGDLDAQHGNEGAES